MTKRKVSINDIERVIGAHLVVLPESIDDPSIRSALQWIISVQPDANFFINLIREGRIEKDGSPVVPLDEFLDEDYVYTIECLCQEEERRRDISIGALLERIKAKDEKK